MAHPAPPVDPASNDPSESCPACGRPLAAPSEELRRCAFCGSAVTVAPPPSSADLYAQPAARRFARPVAAALALGTHEQLRLVGPLPPGSRVLDLGAGDGRLATALAEAGHEVTAVEPFRPLRATGSLTVVRDSIGAVELPERSFDVAVLWHVLEHLPDPLAALESVRRWLVPGGRLLVGVPNLDSLQAEIGGERWFHLDPERHVVHFTPDGLLTLLTRAGFTDVQRRPVVVDQALAGMWMTLLNRVTTRRDALRSFVRHEPVARRDLVLTAAVGMTLLPAAVLLELGAVAAGQGGALAVLGRAP